MAQNLAATGSIAGGTARRVKGFDPGDVTVSYSFIANDIDVSTGLRLYREAVADCGGPDDIRMITVTGTFTPSRAGAWGFLGFLIPTVTAAHTERCIGRS